MDGSTTDVEIFINTCKNLRFLKIYYFFFFCSYLSIKNCIIHIHIYILLLLLLSLYIHKKNLYINYFYSFSK